MTYLGFPVRMKQHFRTMIRQWWLVLVLLLLGLILLLALQFSHKPFRLALVKTISVEKEPLGLALSPDFSTAYVVNAQSGTLSIIDTASQTVVNTLSVNPRGRLNSVIISPEGTTLYVTDAKSGTVEVFRLPEGQKTC